MTTIRQTLRRLGRRPGFALSFSLPLALALAGAGVMFTLVRGVLVDPLPFSEPHRLVQISERNLAKGGEKGRVAVADFYDMKRLESFESVAGYLPPWRTPMSGSGGVTKVRTGNGTYNLLDTLGVAPVAGRLYTAADESGDARIVVVTTGFAIELAGSANAAVGRTIVLEGTAYEIVGVVDPRMTLPVAELDVLVPIRHSESMKANRKSHVLFVVGRLAEGTTVASAQAELDVLMDGIRKANPEEKTGEDAVLTPLHDEVVGEVRKPLLILFAAIGILLLIAVTNVSGIAVARARSRAGELAVRQSLGASALRAWFPVALEGMILSIVSGGVAVMAAIAGVRFAVAATADWVPRVRHVEPEPIDVALVMAYALLAGLVVSAVTAFVAARPAGSGVLRGAGWSGVAVTRDRLRASIVVAQVALSFVLLAGSAVLVRSMVDLLTTDPGYRTSDVLTVDLELPSGRYESVASQTAAFRRVVDAVGALPGVDSAAATSSGPVSGARITRSFFLEEPDAARRRDYPYLAITPGYFATMGIPLLRGRAFDERDTAEAPLVLVVNESFARRESPDGDLLGKRISFAGAEGPWIEVVGIAADTRHEGVDTEPEPQFYVPDTQRTWTWLDWTTLVVRVDGIRRQSPHRCEAPSAPSSRRFRSTASRRSSSRSPTRSRNAGFSCSSCRRSRFSLLR